MYELILVEYRDEIQHAVLYGLCAYAIWKGDGPEKATAAVLLLMVGLDAIFHYLFPHDDSFEGIIVSHLALDLIVFFALIPIALRANRMYPLWLLAAQLISTVMHINRGAVPEGMAFAYWLLTRLPSYIQLVAFGVGLALHRRRIRRYGSYRSWRNSSDR